MITAVLPVAYRDLRMCRPVSRTQETGWAAFVGSGPLLRRESFPWSLNVRLIWPQVDEGAVHLPDHVLRLPPVRH